MPDSDAETGLRIDEIELLDASEHEAVLLELLSAYQDLGRHGERVVARAERGVKQTLVELRGFCGGE